MKYVNKLGLAEHQLCFVKCEQARAGRASVHGEVCGQDRACDASFAVHGEVCGHDRAHGACSAVLGGVYHRDGGKVVIGLYIRELP